MAKGGVLMRKIILVSILLFVFGCAEENNPVQPVEPAILQDTLQVVDSIGVLLGDSCCMFGSIADFTTFSGGRPAVLDRVKGTVSVFDRDGSFLFSAGGLGEGPGEFQYPQKLTCLSSGIIVVGELLGAVNALDENGNYLGRWTMPGMAGLPLDLIPFDDSTFVGYYFLTSFQDGQPMVSYFLSRFHAVTGEQLTEYFRWDGNPSPDTDFTPGFLNAAGDGRGRLYVSMAENDRWMVEVFGESSEPLDTLLLFSERERLTAAPDSGFVSGCIRCSYAFSDGSGEMEMHTVNMPEDHPFISSLGVDGEGNIWCRRGGVPGDVWDIVSPEGEHLGEVRAELPDSAYYVQMDVSPEGVLAFDIFTDDYHRLYLME